jgi:hypothetical protein
MTTITKHKEFNLEPNRYLKLCERYGKVKVGNAIKFWRKYYENNTAVYDIMENKEFRVILEVTVIDINKI